MMFGKIFKKKKNKFNARKTGDFPSALEHSVYQLLLLREKAKEIRDIKRQVAVELTRAKIRAKIDFGFFYVKTEKPGFAEAKGIETERWRIIAKLWENYGPAPLEIFKGNFRAPQLVDVIVPDWGGQER